MPASRDAGRELPHGVFWLGLILALLGGQILLMLVMVYLATIDASFAVEPDYYQKGLNWDATAAQQQENARLGWSLQLDVEKLATALGERSVTMSLREKSGGPVDGAIVDLVAFPHSRGNQRQSAALEPVGGGQYETTIRFMREGLWEFRFVIRRRSDTFTHTILRDVHSPGESRPWRR